MNNNIKIIQKASLGSSTTQIGVQYNYYGTDSNINEEIDITDRIKNIVKHKKEIVLKQLLFPWFKQSPQYKDVFPKLFIDPKFKSEESNVDIIDVTPYLGKNLMILGDAGAGKSTFLRIWFAFKEKEKKSNNIISEVLFFDAKEYLMEESFLKDMIKWLRSANHKHYLLLIDAIDEAFYDNYPAYERFILQLQELNNCSIWMGCRKDFYKFYSGGYGMNLSDYDFYIQNWDIDNEVDIFVKTYADIRNVPDLPNRIEVMKKVMGDNSIIEELMRNPFQLSIIVFLAEDSGDIRIHGRYDLYEQFMTKWNKHEILRGTSKYSETDKEHTLFKAALSVYCNEVFVFDEVAENDTGVNALLREPDEEYTWGEGKGLANEFYHRSLAEFILAKMTYKSMLNMKKDGQVEIFKKICKTKMKDDVTNFILDKFLITPLKDKEIIKNNLQDLYRIIPSNSDTLSLREQIIYYLTRLDIDVSDFIGMIIDSCPDNNMIRLSLAYGCTLLRDKKSRKYALDFAEAIASNPDGEEAITNRAWAVVFYGDFHGEKNGVDEYSYRDEEKGSWKKVRENRIQRFRRERPRWKDYRFWILDIPLFHNFLINRDWNDISCEEYEVLKKLAFSSEVFDKEEIEFLEKEQQGLLSDYYNYLKLQGGSKKDKSAYDST